MDDIHQKNSHFASNKKKGGVKIRGRYFIYPDIKKRVYGRVRKHRPHFHEKHPRRNPQKKFFAAEKFSPVQKSIEKNCNPYDSAAPESQRTSRMTPTAMWKNMPTYPRFPHRGSFVPLFVVHICTTKGVAKGVTIGGTNGGARFLEHAALHCSCKSSNDKGSRCSNNSQKLLVPVSLI